jgi:hypothetical protein
LVQIPDDMTFYASVNYVIFWVFGGSYSFWGSLFGAMFLTILPELLRFSVYDRFIMYGVILTAIVILRPQGVITRMPLGRQPTWFGLLPWLKAKPQPLRASASMRGMTAGRSRERGDPKGPTG